MGDLEERYAVVDVAGTTWHCHSVRWGFRTLYATGVKGSKFKFPRAQVRFVKRHG